MNYSSIRNFPVADVVALWNACLSRDLINEEKFSKHVLFDTNFDQDLFIVAHKDDDLAGFIYGTYRKVPDEIAGRQEGKGWIVAMGVLPAYRRQGVGRTMVEKMEARLSEAGVQQIDLCNYTSNYIVPGIDEAGYPGSKAFFDAMGYHEYNTCVSMDINLHEYTYPQKYVTKKAQLADEGIRITPYQGEYAGSLTDFMMKEFPYWMPVCRDLIASGKAYEAMFIALDSYDRTVGFVMRAMDGSDERFGPFGVSASMQGKSVGSLLFHELMLDMCKRRIFYSYFMWTGGRNIDYYGSWGMRVYRNYYLMRKD